MRDDGWRCDRIPLRPTQQYPWDPTGADLTPSEAPARRIGHDDPFFAGEGLGHHRRMDQLSARIAQLEADCNRKANIISDMADELARLKRPPRLGRLAPGRAAGETHWGTL